MHRRYWIFPLVALASLTLAILACNRSSGGEQTPVPTATQSLSPSPTPSATATATPTLTPTPTVTPTPTPLPIVFIEGAQEALRYGNYNAAQAVLEALPVENLSESEAALTSFVLAQSLLDEKDYVGAAEALISFLTEHPDHALVPDAHFYRAEALIKLGAFLDAVDEYRAYLEDRNVIVSYVQLWIGDAYMAAEAYDDAANVYEQALTQAPTLDFMFWIREKLGLTLGYTGDYAAALVQYDAILAAAQDDYLRARIQYQAAQTLFLAGESDAAFTRLYDLVVNYYETPAAYSALVDLINSDQPVDELQRGLVDLNNDAFDAAVAAFYRAIEADLEGHSGVLHYYAGLTYRAAGNYAPAVLEFEKLIDTHPGDPYVDDAWLAKAWTQYLSGDAETAIETYTLFVAEYPFSPLAPDALWWAANIFFWFDDYEGAEELFAQLAADYPTSERAPDGLYRAAYCRSRLQDYLGAEEAWGQYAAD